MYKGQMIDLDDGDEDESSLADMDTPMPSFLCHAGAVWSPVKQASSNSMRASKKLSFELPHFKSGKTTALFYDKRMLKHVDHFTDHDVDTVEVPERIESAYGILVKAGLDQLCYNIPLATVSIRNEDIRLVHADSHVRSMESTASR